MLELTGLPAAEHFKRHITELHPYPRTKDIYKSRFNSIAANQRENKLRVLNLTIVEDLLEGKCEKKVCM